MLFASDGDTNLADGQFWPKPCSVCVCVFFRDLWCCAVAAVEKIDYRLPMP